MFGFGKKSKDLQNINDVINKAKTLNQSGKDKDAIEYLISNASWLSNQERYGGAIELYDEVLEIDPRNVIALRNKSDVLTTLGKHGEARECRDMLEFKDLQNLNDVLNNAKALEESGKHTEAIEYLISKGSTLLELERYAGAIALYDEVLQIDPKNIDALNKKAYTLVELGKYEEAIKYCDKVLEIDPNHMDSLNERNYAVEHLTNSFQNIVNSIKTEFEPEKIDSEDHLQAQLVIFLKVKFPDKEIEREFRIVRGSVDIVVDKKYGFEVKVPQDRIALRNLSAQLDEYREQLESVCAIIFDDESRNLTNDINEYADRYKKNYGIDSIILRGKKRQYSNYN
jgi:tetratricopeptide (TPR) repeat protein